MITEVKLKSFRNTGSSLNNDTLGLIKTTNIMGTAVELQFSLSKDIQKRFKKIRPLQWAAPDAVWFKFGDWGTKWILHSSSKGTGWDLPAEENVYTFNGGIAFYDFPGPNVYKLQLSQPKKVIVRIFCVQNFSSWLVGTPANGGPEQQISEVVGWKSVVHLGILPNKNSDRAVIGFMPESKSGLGWDNPSITPAY